jgi:hypothetical protein
MVEQAVEIVPGMTVEALERSGLPWQLYSSGSHRRAVYLTGPRAVPMVTIHGDRVVSVDPVRWWPFTEADYACPA